MKIGIFAQNINSGFVFKCNEFNYTRGFDFWGNNNSTISNIQIAGNTSTENIFNPSPSIPSGRMNLYTMNTSLRPNFYYFYTNGVTNTNPLNYTLTYTSKSIGIQRYLTCNQAIPRILPNHGSTSNDNTYGISSLELNSLYQNKLVHSLDIMEKSKLICDYFDNDLLSLDSNLTDSLVHDISIEPNLLDSAIYILNGDTSFAAIYTLSKLYLNSPNTIANALSLVSNSNTGHPEMANYKVLFPIIVDGITNGFNSNWLSNHEEDLESLSNFDGFIAGQAKSMLDYYTNNSLILNSYYTSQSYDFNAIATVNPFINSLELNITNNESILTNIEIELFDKSGASQIKTSVNINTINPNVINLNTSFIPNGLYSCVITSGGNLLKCIYLYKN